MSASHSIHPCSLTDMFGGSFGDKVRPGQSTGTDHFVGALAPHPCSWQEPLPARPRSSATSSPERTAGAQPSGAEPQAKWDFMIFLTTQLFRTFQVAGHQGSHQCEKNWGAWPWLAGCWQGTKPGAELHPPAWHGSCERQTLHMIPTLFQ